MKGTFRSTFISCVHVNGKDEWKGGTLNCLIWLTIVINQT